MVSGRTTPAPLMTLFAVESTFGAPSGGMLVGGQPGGLSTKFGAMKPSRHCA
jgi:hypothetical protein